MTGMNGTRLWLITGALLGLASVALGAFGAHGLRGHVSADLLAVWGTATDYMGLHAVAILICGLWLLLRPATPFIHPAGWAFLLGVLVFSGSLLAMVLTGLRGLGMMTPIGGVLLLSGWGLLAAGAWRVRETAE